MASPRPARVKISRKALREPDEFQTLTTQAMAWVRANQRLATAGAAALLAVAVIGLLVGWYRNRRIEAASIRFQSAHEEFMAGKYGEAAESFAGLVGEYGGTSFGRLGLLYRGHALLRANDAAGAATAYGEYLASSPATPYLRQEALVGQARALEAKGDAAAALQAYGDAAAIEGPFRADARLAQARLKEAGGQTAEATEIYRALLKETPEGPLRSFLESKLPPGTADTGSAAADDAAER